MIEVTRVDHHQSLNNQSFSIRPSSIHENQLKDNRKVPILPKLIENAWEMDDINHDPSGNRKSLSSSKSHLSEVTQYKNINSGKLLHRNSIFPNTALGQINSNDTYGQTQEQNQRKKRKTGVFCHCCSCSFFRIFLFLTIFLLIGIVLTVILITVINNPKTTTTTTTSVTTTTTTPYICNSSCTNQTWISSSPSNQLAQWLFDENLSDQLNNYNATTINNISFVTNGYIKQAIAFTANANQTLYVPHIPLSNTSFTIDTWLYITGLLNLRDQSIFGYCPIASSYQCLHLTIHQNGPDFNLYFGFYNADCLGITPLILNTWIHVAFVFDITTLTQSIYLNGILENTCNTFLPIIAPPSNITIGYIPGIASTSILNYYQGYIDQMTVSNRAKSSCEILEIATLVAHFTFDTGLFLIDSGPNSLQAITQSTSSISTGHLSQAITFDGSSSSYFQIQDIVSLGISDKSFSISLWIRPVSLSGILIHLSNNSLGTGWCLPLIGFAANGSLIAQISNNNGIISISDSTMSIYPSSWSHIVQTWSSTNGLRLFINNILVTTRLNLATTYTASSTVVYMTLANTRNGTGSCVQGQFNSLTSYKGDMDDIRIYSRELSSDDICTLYIH